MAVINKLVAIVWSLITLCQILLLYYGLIDLERFYSVREELVDLYAVGSW